MSIKAEDNYLKKELYELIKNDESIFDFIQEGSLDGLWYWDLENPENEWMSPKFWTVLGYNPDEMPHKSSAWQHIINQADLKVAMDNFTKHCENPNHPYDQVVRYTHKNGSTVWIHCRGIAIRDKNDKPTRMMGAHHNITSIRNAEIEIKEARQKSEENEQLFKKLFDESSDAILLIDNTGVFVECNQAALDLLKMTREQFLFKPPSMISPEFQPDGRKSDEAAIDMIQLAYKKGLHRFDWTCLNSENEEFVVEVSLMPTVVKGQTMLHTTWRDVTQRIKSEIELKQAKEKAEENQRFSTLITEQSPDIIYVYDILTKKNVYTNKNIRELLNYEIDTVPENSTELINQLVHPDDLKNFYYDDKISNWETEYVHNFEYRLKDALGNWRWFSGREREFQRSKNKVVSLIGVVRDITEQKKAQVELQKAKEKAEASQNQLLANLENTPNVAVQWYDEQGHIIYWNNASAVIYGWTSQETIGKTLDQLIHTPEEAAEFLRIIAEIRRTGKTFGPYESAIKRRDGTPGWVLATTFMIELADGKNGFVCMDVDITESKRSAEALRKSETFQRHVFESSRLPIVVMDANTYEFVDCNPAAIEIYGYTSKEQVIGLRPLDVSNPIQYDETPSAERAKYYIEKAKIEGFAVYEWLHQRRDGTKWDAEVHLLSFEADEKKLLQFSLVDITARKAAEREKQMERLFGEKLVSSLPVIFYMYDTDLKLRRWNQKHVEELEYGNEELEGLPIETWHRDPLIAEQVRNNLQDVFIYNSFESIEAVLYSKSDKPIPYLLTGVRIDTPQGPMIMGIGLNISKQKNAEHNLVLKNQEYEALNDELLGLNRLLRTAKEKAEESDRLKTAFLQNMSHEIRTPMNAIMGFSSLLPDNFDNKNKLEYFSKIIEMRSKDLLLIINDILDISKIESGQSIVNLEDCNINELFDELGVFFKDYQIRIKKQELILNFYPTNDDSPSTIKTDRLKLKQIIINLVSNALKFTETGSISCGCKLENNKLQFYVSDTGIGIPADKHGFVFERFSQLKHPYFQNIGGTGLGLPIVKGLVNLMGGDVWLESEPGKGTTFYFTINYVKADLKKPKNLTTDDIHNIVTDKTILIVEDDFFNAQYLQMVIGSITSNIITAADGLSAVKIAKEQKIDLILMDIRLPDITGYEATRLILEEKPSIKIIAQSAYAANIEYQNAIEAGCVDFISKPTKREQLLTLMSKYLKE